MKPANQILLAMLVCGMGALSWVGCGGNSEAADAGTGKSPAANASAQSGSNGPAPSPPPTSSQQSAATPGAEADQDMSWLVQLASPDSDTRDKALDKLEAVADNNPKLFLGFVDAFADPVFAAAIKENKYRETFGAARELLKPHIDGLKALAPELILRLDHAVPMVKAVAAAALSECGEAALPALPKLVAMLDHVDSDVKSSALSTLGEMGEPAKAHGTKIAALVASDDEQVRRHARRASDKLGATPSVAVLKQLLSRTIKDDEERLDTERWVIGKLGASGEAARDMVPMLIEKARAPEGPMVYEALEALKQLGPVADSAIPDIVALIKQGVHRYTGIQALAAMGRAGYVQLWGLRILEDPELRADALRGIGMSPLADEQAARMLGDVIRDHGVGYDEKRGAADGLAAMGVRAVPQILSLLADDTGGLIRSVIEQGDDGVWQHLARVYSQQSSANRKAVLEAVGYEDETKDTKLKLVMAALEDTDEGVLTAATGVIERFGSRAKAAAPKLVPLAVGTPEDLKCNALSALAALDPQYPGADRVALAAIESESERVRKYGLMVMEGTKDGGFSSITAIVGLLETGAWGDERFTVQRVLANMGEPALASLLEYATSGNVHVRRGVVEAIFTMLQWSADAEASAKRGEDPSIALGPNHPRPRIIKREIFAELLPLLDDEDPGVRSTVGNVIGMYGEKALGVLLPVYPESHGVKREEILRIFRSIASGSTKPDQRLFPIFRAALEATEDGRSWDATDGLLCYPKQAKALATEYMTGTRVKLRMAALGIAESLLQKDQGVHAREAIDLMVKGMADDDMIVRKRGRELVSMILDNVTEAFPKDLADSMRKALEKSQERDKD